MDRKYQRDVAKVEDREGPWGGILRFVTLAPCGHTFWRSMSHGSKPPRRATCIQCWMEASLEEVVRGRLR